MLCNDGILPSEEKRISKEEDAKKRGENGLHRSIGRNKKWTTFIICPALQKEAQP